MEELKKIILSLNISDEEKQQLLKELKAAQKLIDSFEFKYKRTMTDKAAITNILNASIEEIEKQKKIIENTKDEINRTLVEVDQQKKLVEEKNTKLNELITNLTNTQKQLVMSEKMASLGELTAGIAHEIQNPLNFVNNFSEVSIDLLSEMKLEFEKGNTAAANEIVSDVTGNLEKINHHGKRAEAIVRGMLQHSRSGSGQKELTDINALTDEYLRLTYHGLRAKDKQFNVTMHTDYDPALSGEEKKINILPQEIGRVILNLLTNAFYATNRKNKELNRVTEPAYIKSENRKYEPAVWAHTKKFNGGVEISIKDNGNGIPKNILEKIFNPFFTTKPTGEGTGLGLSLSYDIIKAHNGDIKVRTVENEGTEFIILLPV